MNQDISPELYELRKRIRHSAAHVMADVTTKMFPEAKLAIGPVSYTHLTLPTNREV